MPHLSYSERKALRHIPAVISSHPQFNLKEKKNVLPKNLILIYPNLLQQLPEKGKDAFLYPGPQQWGDSS